MEATHEKPLFTRQLNMQECKSCLDEIGTEIEKAEKTGTGSFYTDDTFLYLPDTNTEILFCHEYDIHLKYNKTNKVVNDIINAWRIRGIIQKMKEGK